MKKFLVILICFTIFTLTACSNNTNNDSNPTNIENSGLGHTVNVVTAESYNDFIEGYSVLDTEQVDKLTIKSTNKEYTDFNEFSSTSIEEISSSSDFGYKIGLKGSFKSGMLTNIYGEFSSQFERNTSTSETSYSNQYFYVYEKFVIKNKTSFENYLENDYTSILSDGYLNSLDDLSTDALTYDEFFSNYGTHLIVSAEYGGKLTAYFSAATNKKVFNSEVTNSIQATISGGIQGKIKPSVSGEVSTSFDIAETLGMSSTDIQTNFTSKAIGGSTFTGNSIETFSTAQESWSNSFNTADSYVLMNYTDDGLIAIWDLLPEEYSDLQEEMMDAFEQYYDNYATSILSEFQSAQTQITYTNSTERTFDDTGLYGYDCDDYDEINLSVLNQYASEDYIFRFDFTLKMNEINNGYQEVWIYNAHYPSVSDQGVDTSRNDAQSNGMVTGYSDIAYGGNELNQNTNNQLLTLFVSGDQINETMWIKYDAHGEGEDSWTLHEVVIQITAIPVTKTLENTTSRQIVGTGAYGLAPVNNEKTDTLDLLSFTNDLNENYIYTFILEIDMAQIDQGYQGFYLYDNKTITNTENVEASVAVESGLIDTIYDYEYPSFINQYDYSYDDLDTSTSTVYITLQVRGDQLQETTYLRYDAMGSGTDAWNLHNITVYVYNELISDIN